MKKKIRLVYPEVRALYKDERDILGELTDRMVSYDVEIDTEKDTIDYATLLLIHRQEALAKISARIERKLNKIRNENIKEMLSIANSIGVMYGD